MTRKPSPSSPMIGMQAVADTVGVSRATLRRRITAGRFPAPARFSRRSLRWRVATLEEWLTDNAAKASATAGEQLAHSDERAG